jgi:hypothetical protein
VKTLLLTTAAVFLVSLLVSPTLGAGWFWDLGNGFGFAAFSGLLYLSLASARAMHHAAHRRLAYAVLLLAALHVFWLLLGDAVVVEYLVPGAPLYMWAGLAGFALLNLLMLAALPRYRPRIHGSRADFRRWHRALAIAVTAGSAWHILVAGHYLRSPLQWLAFAALAAFASFAYRFGRDNNDLDRRASRRYLVVAAVAVALFTLVRNTPS